MGRKKKKRGPGRPKGSKTKAKRGRPPKLAAKRRGRPPKAKRGRPKGSKTKKKAAPKAKRGRPVADAAKKNAFEQQLLASIGALVVSVEKLVTIQLNRIPNIKPATAATTRIQGAQVSTPPAEAPIGALDA